MLAAFGVLVLGALALFTLGRERLEAWLDAPDGECSHRPCPFCDRCHRCERER